MITHREAEILTSARQDAPLDPVVERELQAHLATCEECRAFAIATERLTDGIKAIPSVPVNPRIRREVMETVNAGSNPLARIFAGIGGGFQSGPVLAAAAAVVIIGLFGWMALDRLVLDGNGGGDDNQIAAVPTEQPVERFVASPTQVPATDAPAPTEPVAPTETTAPAEPTATLVPENDATDTEEGPVDLTTTSTDETETPVPTEVPVEPTAPPSEEPTVVPTVPPTAEPTVPPTVVATEVPPTEVPAPTEPVEPTTPPEPTATSELDTNATDTEEGPVDLTNSSSDATETPATEVAPTEVPVEPTAVPTDPPTAEPTNEPTAAPTEIPATEAPPAIEPMDGAEVVDVVATSEVLAGTGSAGNESESGDTQVTDGTSAADLGDLSTAEPENTDVPIEPTDGSQVSTDTGDISTAAPETDEATVEPIEGIDGTGEAPEATSETGDDGSVIEPVDGAPVEVEQTPEGSGNGEVEPVEESTPAPDDSGVGGTSSGNVIPMSEAAVPYTGIDGDPSGRLGLTPLGALQFMSVPDAASMTTSAGYQVQMSDAQPGVVNLCGESGCEPGMEVPESDGWQGDVPLGVVGETVYVMRMYGDRTEIYSATPSGTQLVEPQLLLETAPTSPPSAVYQSEGMLFAWLPSGQWLEIQSGSAELYSGAFTNPTGIRFAPVANQGPVIGYFSEGMLVIAPISAPDSPIFSVPSDGVDFDMTPLADRVAVIRGNDIVVYDINGNELMVYQGGDMQPGSLIWLNSGIVFVDRNTGGLYQIPETAT